MNNIGRKIKELRRKNDLTQEKLADLLGVTYQSVSKWETGTTYPDLGMIVPLAKLLHVTTDELFGLHPDDAEVKREEYERLHEELAKKGDLTGRIKLIEEAMREYPEDMKWRNRYAWDIWCEAVGKMGKDDTAAEAGREKAIKLFDTVIENTDDDAVKAHAIEGIVQCLCGKGCKEEARRYVELFPEVKVSADRKNDLLGKCLDGEERIRHKQMQLHIAVEQVVRQLLWAGYPMTAHTEDVVRAAESVIKAIIPDGNYITYHHPLAHIHIRLAQIAAGEGRAEDAMTELTEAVYHAKEYDRIDCIAPGAYGFTAPLLDHVSFNSADWYRVDNGGIMDDIVRITKRKEFDLIRDRADFKELMR